MSVRVDISSLFFSYLNLKEEMRELLRLRRALCLLNAKRNRTQWSRRRGARRISRAVIGTPNIKRTAAADAPLVVFAHARLADRRRLSDQPPSQA
jgi:hypothetical protein